MNGLLPLRELPPGLERLRDLALDLRWTWSHGADHLWRMLDRAAWERLENPWMLLQDVSSDTLERFASDATAMAELRQLDEARQRYLAGQGWFATLGAPVRGIAYFSMEFGLGEALPLYAGGLGVLAGDYLKASSDLGLPTMGIGLLYQEGFFRQALDVAGNQLEVFPYNDPTSLPIQPVRAANGGWLHVQLDFPGRLLHLRVWEARVGRTVLYLLDSNDPLNSPADRGITGKLYGGDRDLRFLQEVVLGIGGWRVVEALGRPVDVCHLNEGHAALALLERARSLMQRTGLGFREALWATRPGNVFTTHTAVDAAFDAFDAEFVDRHRHYLDRYIPQLGIPLEELLRLGRRDPDDTTEPFNLSFLALRGCAWANGVSALHQAVSRRLFQGLFPRWPEAEVPVTHVTNGVHVPTWDSPSADRLWEQHCGKERWLGSLELVECAMAKASDEELWTCRNESRAFLVRVTRSRLARQLARRGADAAAVEHARQVMDPRVLTLGYARRITGYKRPTLLLHDEDRLERMLAHPDHPVQLVVAGKAHPDDAEGKDLLRQLFTFSQRESLRDRVVFLEDYDITLAEEIVRGVDVWLNTPRRPWEASGTSGMKVLANGGLNLSELDGWWAEAYAADVGWAIGDGREHDEPGWDATEAEQLYGLLEEEIIPAFYSRDAAGLPRRWLARIRASMSRLAPRFSANRMVREYATALYLPAADLLRARLGDDARLAHELRSWAQRLRRMWDNVGFGEPTVEHAGEVLRFSVPVYLGPIPPADVRVELYADAVGDEGPSKIEMLRGEPLDAEANGAIYHATVPAARPAAHYTARVRPYHDHARVPTELALIRWER